MVVIKERRGRSGWGGGGRKSGSGIAFPFIVGLILGFVGDMFYGSLGLPGYKHPTPQCSALMIGDLYQIGGFAGLGLAASLLQSTTASTFAWGGMIGTLVPKMLAANGISRYGLFDFDPSSGVITPKFRSPV